MISGMKDLEARGRRWMVAPRVSSVCVTGVLRLPNLCVALGNLGRD